MKTLLAVISLAALGGCAVAPPGPAYYGTRAPQAAYNPYEWHTVSSTPVVQNSTVVSTPSVQYTDQPVYVQQQPVYVEQPVYVPAPVYAQPYYYNPPVSVDLVFGFGGGYRGGWGGYRGGWGRGRWR